MAAQAAAAPTSSKYQPSDFLKAVLGRPVVVKLNSGVAYKGVLGRLVKDFKSKADYNKFLNEEYAKEPNPTQKQLDAYMRKGVPWRGSKASRFLDYLEELHLLERVRNGPSVGGSFAARWARMVLKRRSSERGEREKRFYGDGKGERRRTAFSRAA